MDEDNGETRSGRSPRFTTWAAFLLFSVVTMTATVQEKNKQDSLSKADQGTYLEQNAKWALASTSITFSLVALAVLMQLHPIGASILVGSTVEGIFSLFLVILTVISVSLISNDHHGLATKSAILDSNSSSNGQTTVVNGNLYYFGWASFVTAIILFVSYLRGVFGLDVVGELRHRGDRLALWGGMLASAVVILGSSSELLSGGRCDGETVLCKRTRFAVSVGVLGMIISLIVVGMKLFTASLTAVSEGAVALFLAVLNGFGVAFITSAKGPGSGIGNLYYFSWVSFLCAFMLTAQCYESYKNGNDIVSDSGNPNSSGGTGEIQIESMDDKI